MRRNPARSTQDILVLSDWTACVAAALLAVAVLLGLISIGISVYRLSSDPLGSTLWKEH